MAVKHSLSYTYRTNNGSVSVPALSVESDAELVYDGTIPAGAVNKRITMALDVSNVKSVAIVVAAITATKAITVKTNSTSAPDDTLTLTPAAPGFVWMEGMPFDNPLGTDVTDFYVTSTDTVDRNLKIYACADVTP
jgi:hypothetical protein